MTNILNHYHFIVYNKNGVVNKQIKQIPLMYEITSRHRGNTKRITKTVQQIFIRWIFRNFIIQLFTAWVYSRVFWIKSSIRLVSSLTGQHIRYVRLFKPPLDLCHDLTTATKPSNNRVRLLCAQRYSGAIPLRRPSEWMETIQHWLTSLVERWRPTESYGLWAPHKNTWTML